MNHTFSGFMLLSIIVLCMLVLFIVASFMKPKKTNQTSNQTVNRKKAKQTQGAVSWHNFGARQTTSKQSQNLQLTKLKERIVKHFPEFTATLRQNHIMLGRASQKVAMLTLDTTGAMGRRRLGEVTVINFHKLPSVNELRIELSGV